MKLSHIEKRIPQTLTNSKNIIQTDRHWANDVSVPRKVTPGSPGWNFFVQCPGLIFLAACWSGPAASVSIFSVCLDYILRVCQSLWDSFLYLESFVGFYICYYPISTILACLFSFGVRISWKTLCWMRACRRKWHLVFPTLYIIIVDRVNLNKLLQIFTKLRWSNKDNNN